MREAGWLFLVLLIWVMGCGFFPRQLAESFKAQDLILMMHRICPSGSSSQITELTSS